MLAGLRGRRSAWRGVVALSWAALTVAHLVADDVLTTVLWGLGGLAWGWSWWASPEPHLRRVTADTLLVHRGLRTRAVSRADVLDVQPEHAAGYGLELTVRDADPVTLPGTALRFSVAAEQAAALRRWAGLDGPVS